MNQPARCPRPRLEPALERGPARYAIASAARIGFDLIEIADPRPLRPIDTAMTRRLLEEQRPEGSLLDGAPADADVSSEDLAVVRGRQGAADAAVEVAVGSGAEAPAGSSTRGWQVPPPAERAVARARRGRRAAPGWPSGARPACVSTSRWSTATRPTSSTPPRTCWRSSRRPGAEPRGPPRQLPHEHRGGRLPATVEQLATGSATSTSVSRTAATSATEPSTSTRSSPRCATRGTAAPSPSRASAPPWCTPISATTSRCGATCGATATTWPPHAREFMASRLHRHERGRRGRTPTSGWTWAPAA